jgi:steroid delta-isomerase-like uncharacterized protein
MSERTEQFAKRYSAAWAAHDPDAIVAMHTDDSVFHIHGGIEPVVGRDAVREAFATYFEQSPDLRFEPQRLHFGEDHFVSEYVMSGTREGTQFACDGTDVFTLREGLVARKDTYLDLVTYQRQLGLDVVATGTT